MNSEFLESNNERSLAGHQAAQSVLEVVDTNQLVQPPCRAVSRLLDVVGTRDS